MDSFATEEVGVTWAIFDRDVLEEGEPIGVFGLAADGVAGVRVVIDGEEYAAELANNGFFYQHSDRAAPMEAVEEIVVQYANGSTHRISSGIEG